MWRTAEKVGKRGGHLESSTSTVGRSNIFGARLLVVEDGEEVVAVSDFGSADPAAT